MNAPEEPARRPRPLPAPFAAAVAAAALWAAAGGTLAQDAQPPPEQPPAPDSQTDDGPIIVGEHAGEWKPWDLRSFRTGLDLYTRYQHDRLKTPGQPTQTQDDLVLRAATQIDFESYIGHRNFIDLIGSFQIGYEYEDLSTNAPGAQSSRSGSLSDLYNVQARILGESLVPLTLYSLREETLQSREFASTLKTNTLEHGAIGELRSEIAPLRVQYFHREQTQSDPLGQVDQTQIQDTFALFGSVRLTERQRLEYNYAFDEVDETQGSIFQNAFDRHDAAVTHILDFGESNEHNLRSSLRLFDETGRFSQTRVRLDELLSLQHTDRLDSRYNFALEEQTFGDVEQRQLLASATIRHRLFESLVSTATAGGSVFEVPGEFTSSTEYVSGTLDYTKRVPLGRLDASLAGAFSHQDNGDRGSELLVRDETQTFNDPFDIIIQRRNVVVGSVTITDQAHFPRLEGTDFTVRYFPDRIEIHRQPLGSIVNGQSVLVSYRIGPEPGSQIDTTSGSFALRYTFTEGLLSGLSPYLYYQNTTHSVDAVDPSRFVLDDVQDWRYGLEYRLEGLDLVLERQNHDSTVSPYDQMRYLGRYDVRFDRLSSLSLELARDEIDYRLDRNHVELNRALGRYRQEIGDNMNLQLYLQYRDEHDDRNGNVHGFEQEVQFTWRVRQTYLYATFHNSMLSGDGSERLSQTFTFGLNRTF